MYVLPMIGFCIVSVISCGIIVLKYGLKKMWLEMRYRKNISKYNCEIQRVLKLYPAPGPYLFVIARQFLIENIE